MITRALRNQGKDNITAILVDLSSQDLASTQEVEAVVAPAPVANIKAAKQKTKLWLAALIPGVVIGALAALWVFSQN